MEPTTAATVHDSREELGARLRQSRLWCGASQKSLAAASGVSRHRVGLYEKGRLQPRAEHFLRFAQVLNANLEYLLLGRNPPDEEAIAEMRLQWRLGQISESQTATVLELIDGLLSQMPAHFRSDFYL